MVFSNSFQKMINELKVDSDVATALCVYKNDLLTDDLDYITMRGQLISYLPAGREHTVNDDGRWKRDGRQEAKIGRVIQRIMPQHVIDYYHITDSKIEKFTNAVRSYIMTNGDDENGDSEKISLAVCNGRFIPLYYRQDNYSEFAGGNLTNSCMKDKDDSLFEIYESNPDKVSMVVALDSSHKVLGRALLWKTDNNGMCMDTIYSKDDIKPMFIKFAIENGFRYKSSQSCHHNQFDMFAGNTISNEDTYITLDYWDFDEYPYVDTLMYLDTQDGTLSNSAPSSEYRELRNTDGSYDTENGGVEDVITGQYIRESDGTYVDYKFEGSWYTGYTECETVYARETGGHVWIDHSTEVNGNYYLSDSPNIVYVDRFGTYYHIDDIVYDEYGDAIPCDDAVETVDGDWVWLDDAVETSEGWLLQEDCEEIDGEWVRKGNNQNQNQEA